MSSSNDRRSPDIVTELNKTRNLKREKLLLTRETIALKREISTSKREQIVATKESEHAITEVQMIMLTKANSNLVKATIEATELAEKLEIAKKELEIAKNLAEKASLAKSDFLSSMSHELRTPLNAILGFAQLLESSSPLPTESQSKRLNQITKAGWYLLELINQILELAVIESGKLNVLKENVSINEVILECQIMIEPQAQNNNITLQILPFDPLLTVHADKTRLKQVIFNLLSNAIKYNKNYGIVEVSCSTSTLGIIHIGIKDSGIGLSQEKLDQLFQPFNRLGQENGLKQGTGIGLMISKELVELMGGTIGVNSEVGVGSEFWIEFSRVPAQVKNAEAAVFSASKSSRISSKSKKILLYVEDNPANLALVEQIIIDYPNISLLTATDGNMGIAMARLHKPKVILLDINLPGISGYETLKILQNDETTAQIPVLAISANAMKSDQEKAMKAGFQSYITKPINIKEFIKTLEVALKL
jgi:signal transduction histidine kinase/CheY-like chemotaxis protein